MNRKIICFDMDGTLADFYNVPHWLEYLQNDNPLPYIHASPLYNMYELNEVCSLLRKNGWRIEIITALSKNSNQNFKQVTRQAKKDWLTKHNFDYDTFHAVDYSTIKREVIRREMKKYGGEAILIDDEERHINKWSWGKCIKPDEDLIDKLWDLLEN